MSDERLDPTRRPGGEPVGEPLLPGLADPAGDDGTALLLRQVLHREAARVAPRADGLERIRAAVAAGRDGVPAGVTSLDSRRRPGLAGLARRSGPLAAAAAAVVLVAGAGGAVVGRVTTPSKVVTRYVPLQPVTSVPVYFLAAPGSVQDPQDDLSGASAGLVIERHTVQADRTDRDAVLTAAVNEAIGGRPYDRDFFSPFRGVHPSTAQARWDAGTRTVDVTLSTAMATRRGASTALARLAVQQLVWTATNVVGVPEAAVRFEVRGGEQTMFGRLPLEGRRFTRATGQADPRAPIWIADPGDDTTLTRSSITVDGQARRGLDRVQWLVELDGRTLDRGTARRSQGDTPTVPYGTWSFALDAHKPGTYRIVVAEDLADAGGWSATRSFVVN